jgi:hypothetical protein
MGNDGAEESQSVVSFFNPTGLGYGLHVVETAGARSTEHHH